MLASHPSPPWLQSGGLIYYHRPAGSRRAPQRWVIKPGQMFYTPPGYEHAMVFTKYSVWFVFARNNREMANYEADTIRVTPLEPPARAAGARRG